jgi:thioredoxin 1
LRSAAEVLDCLRPTTREEFAAMPTKAVTDASFEPEVLKSDKPVLVDFWADWCGPCKMIGPALEEISDELAEQVTIAKMDIVENTGVPGQIGVQSIPLMVLFKDG